MANVARRTHRLQSRALSAIISMAQCAGAHSRGPLTIARHAMGCQPSVI
jgi:hypothetical protein